MSEAPEAAANNRTPQEDEIDFLKGELRHFKSSGIIEVAVRNQSVKEYMEHWEGRALKAEARCAELEKALKTVRAWAPARCPCKEETPDPCPLCGASVAEGVCMSAENTIPRDVLKAMNATLQGQDNGT